MLSIELIYDVCGMSSHVDAINKSIGCFRWFAIISQDQFLQTPSPPNLMASLVACNAEIHISGG